MLGKPRLVDLDRKLTSHYLLCGLAAIAWLGIGIVWALNSSIAERKETLLVTQLKRAAAEFSISSAQRGTVHLQDLIVDLTKQHAPVYCCAVADGRYIAHSSPRFLGLPHVAPTGAKTTVQAVERTRYVNTDSQLIREYALPISGNGQLISLLIAVAEPKLASQLLASADHIPLAFLTPLVLIAVGLMLLRKTIRPLNAIDAQLRQLATLPSLTNFQPQLVPASGGAALGWNRLVQCQATQSQHGGTDLAQVVDRYRDEKSHDILNSLSEGIAIVDTAGKVTFANDAMIALLDRRAGDSLCGSRFETSLEKRWCLPTDGCFEDADARQRIVSADVVHRDPAADRTLRLTRHPIRSRGAGASGHVWTVRDVSQQKLTERTREQFLDTATHEMRTPLANIKAYSETLALADIADIEQQKEFLNLINTEATRLARFVDDLLSLSSIEAGSLTVHKQQVDTARMFAEIISKVMPQMEQKQIQFESSLPEKMPELILDKDKTAATLVNLLGNAAKYTPTGGRVALRVRVSEEELLIDVEDTGFGIKQDELPRVFDKFFRSADDRVQLQAGTGLGLSLAREVIQLQGGELSVQSELNKGSVFSIRLPAEQGRSAS